MRLIRLLLVFCTIGTVIPMVAEEPEAINFHHQQTEILSIRWDDVQHIVLEEEQIVVVGIDGKKINLLYDEFDYFQFGSFTQVDAMQPNKTGSYFDAYVRGKETLVVQCSHLMSTIRLVDVSGKSITMDYGDNASHELEISISELPAGVYMVMAYGNQSVNSKKIIIK